MKQIIVVFTILMLGLWYSGVNKEIYRDIDDKTYLSRNEVKYLYGEGKINRPNYSREYYSKRRTSYFYKRTWIPMVYSRDTISDTGIHYYSEAR